MSKIIEEFALPERQTCGLIGSEDAIQLVMEVSGWDSASAGVWLAERIEGKDPRKFYGFMAPDIGAWYKQDLEIDNSAEIMLPICNREPRISLWDFELRELLIRREDIEAAISSEPHKPVATIRLIDGPSALYRVIDATNWPSERAQDWLEYRLKQGRIRGWKGKWPSDVSMREIGPKNWPPLGSFHLERTVMNTDFTLGADCGIICIDELTLDEELGGLPAAFPQSFPPSPGSELPEKAPVGEVAGNHVDSAAATPAPQLLAESRADPETQCGKWLAEEMRNSPEPSQKISALWQKEAKQRYPGLSGNAFRRAWAGAIKETGSKWGRPGRKSSR